MSDMSDSETRATQKLYNGGVTRYNVDISGEDKDKVIEILNRYDELELLLKETLDNIVDEADICWKKLVKLKERK